MSAATALSASDWLALLQHFATLSLLAVGGAITTAPDMHRFLVDETSWLSDADFNASIALAQAAPGPNVLFVALVGYHLGLNADPQAQGWAQAMWACAGVMVAMLGIMLPSSVLTYTATRWAHRHRQHLGVRAFKAGMAPVVIALLLATAWLLTAAHAQPAQQWPLYALTLACAALVRTTQVHMLWLIAAGAALGALGWV